MANSKVRVKDLQLMLNGISKVLQAKQPDGKACLEHLLPYGKHLSKNVDQISKELSKNSKRKLSRQSLLKGNNKASGNGFY